MAAPLSSGGTNRASRQTTTTATVYELPGLGSRRAQWNATHREAPGFEGRDVYLPLISGGQAAYTAVFGDDRVLTYIFYMEPDTSVSDAEARVQSELPADARPGPMRDGGPCQLQEWRSPTLERVLNGLTAVTAYSDDPTYKKYRIATLSVGTPGDEGGC